MGSFFDFEADFVDSLRCIPMIVRLKLDTCGVKLKLAEWNHFTQAECEQLVELPCEQVDTVLAYKEYVSHLIFQHTNQQPGLLPIDPHPAWLQEDLIPVTVLEKFVESGFELKVTQWQKLAAIQRFALIKLSRSQHENSNFLPALQEFSLIP